MLICFAPVEEALSQISSGITRSIRVNHFNGYYYMIAESSGESGGDFAVECNPKGNVTAVRMTGWGLASSLAEASIPTSVRQLLLGDNHLSGTIPPQIGRLTSLSDVDLNINRLSGTLPSELARLTMLRQIRLGENLLSGTLPPGLAALPLSSLSARVTRLSGTLPSWNPSIGSLDLSNTGLSGTLPPELSQLAIVLFDNRLSGTVPPEMWRESLAYATLHNNSLSGTLPTEIVRAPARQLSLDHNAISGTIPPELSQLGTMMTTLLLQSNLLSGTVPIELANLTSLKTLALGDIQGVGSGRIGTNMLSGTIPSEFALLTSLGAFSVSGNALTGTIPVALAALAAVASDLTVFDLSHNDLSLPSSTIEREVYEWATQMCEPRGTVFCPGLPPDSCSAFRGDAVLSILDPDTCVQCDNGSSFFVVALVLLMLLAFGIFVWWTVRTNHALTNWVSTIAILLIHSQNVSLFASLSHELPDMLPSSIARLLTFFNFFNVLDMPEASCVVRQSFGVFVFTAVIGCILALLMPILVRAGARYHGVLHLVDASDEALSMTFSLLLLFSWMTASDTISKYIRDDERRDTSNFVYDGTTSTYHMSAGDSTMSLQHEVAATVLVPIMLVLQLLVAVYLLDNVLSFKRGIESEGHEWQRGAVLEFLRVRGIDIPTTRLGLGGPIPPRRLKKRVAFLTSRFAPHAPRWQLVLWLHQLALFCMVLASSVTSAVASNSEPPWPHQLVYVLAAIFANIVAWYAQHRTQPYAFRYQNAIQWVLYASSTLLLVLSAIWVPLSADASRTKQEQKSELIMVFLMYIVFLGGLFVATIICIRKLWADRRTLDDPAVASRILEVADGKIDGPLLKRLEDGTLRLLRCSWLVSRESDNVLGRDAVSGAVIMKRRQDLPEEAFLSAEEAVAALKRGDRSILVLSYGWLTKAHPDPHGTTLKVVRQFLAKQPDVDRCGLFWDLAALPQVPRTVAEDGMVKNGLKVINLCYGSITGSSVLIYKDMVVPSLPQVTEQRRAAVIVKLRFHGLIRVLGLLGANQVPGVPGYNSRAYDGEGGRGWCIFEQAVATIVAAYVNAGKIQGALGERFERAENSRAKVIDIGDGVSTARNVVESPKEVMDSADRMIATAVFTSGADKWMVPQKLFVFEWILDMAMQQATTDYASSGKTAPITLQASNKVQPVEVECIRDEVKPFGDVVA